jgi:membrane protease YdiL (CAAX protease family)
MRNLLKSLTPGAEFLVVIAAAFGVMIVTSLYVAFHPPLAPQQSDVRLLALVIYEAMMLGLLGWFLRVREWTAKRIGLAPAWSDPLVGLGLAVAVYAVYFLAWNALSLMSSPLLRAPDSVQFTAKAIHPLTVAAFVLVNPFYEELFVAGYVIAVLNEKRGAIFAINVSVAIRLLTHLYQGVSGVLTVVPMGLIFGYWLARKNRLWPLVAAHAAMNLAGLWYYMRH